MNMLDELTDKLELQECCGSYCSEAGCCPFPKDKDKQKSDNPLESELEINKIDSWKNQK